MMTSETTSDYNSTAERLADATEALAKVWTRIGPEKRSEVTDAAGTQFGIAMWDIVYRMIALRGAGRLEIMNESDDGKVLEFPKPNKYGQREW